MSRAGWVEKAFFWVTLAVALVGVVTGWDALCLAVVVPCTLLIVRYEDRYWRGQEQSHAEWRRAEDERSDSWHWPSR